MANKSKQAPPTRADLYEHLANVPEEFRDSSKQMSLKMMSHIAYGRRYPWSTKDFELGAALGRGKFGRVYLSRERSSGYMVAMKVMFKTEIENAGVTRQILHELEIQSRLKHPNILRMLTWFHDDKRIYLALEFAAGGELYKHLRNAPNHRFDECRAAKYTYQVADALHYCHLNHVIHRDLKPENILLTSSDNVKLADFGWSAHTTSDRRTTLCGTLDYLPPEMINNENYNASVDQWCLGVLCYEFLVGCPPFEGDGTAETYDNIRRLKIPFPKFVSPGPKDLISKLLKRDGNTRMSLIGVMQHTWVKEYMAKRNAYIKTQQALKAKFNEHVTQGASVTK